MLQKAKKTELLYRAAPFQFGEKLFSITKYTKVFVISIFIFVCNNSHTYLAKSGYILRD